MMTRLSFLVFVLIGVLVGCENDFENASVVNKFRVLGIRAEPPEIRPGESSELSVLWADPQEEGREVSFAWMACYGVVPPGTNGANCKFVLPPQVANAAQGGDLFGIPPLPLELSGSGASKEETFKATVIVVLCAGGELPEASELEVKKNVNNINDLCLGGEGLSAYKTVTFSSTDHPNKNPVIDRLMFDGARLEPVPTDEAGTVACTSADTCDGQAELLLYLTDDSFQKYETIEFGKKKTNDESLYVSWFVTGGDFDTIRSAQSDDTLSFEAVWEPEGPGSFTLWAVAHDLRGGVSWKKFVVEALVE
jgi:hypothetical protein